MTVSADSPGLLVQQARALMGGERDALANAANLVGLIFHELPVLNWAGFYFLKGNELVLGPFQGRPACVRIVLGRGVCGRAAQQRKTLRVEDVQAFDDHIVCDPASRSELVVPLIAGSELIGVLDLDSPVTGRFHAADQRTVELLAGLWLELSELPVSIVRPAAGP